MTTNLMFSNTRFHVRCCTGKHRGPLIHHYIVGVTVFGTAESQHPEIPHEETLQNTWFAEQSPVTQRSLDQKIRSTQHRKHVSLYLWQQRAVEHVGVGQNDVHRSHLRGKHNPRAVTLVGVAVAHGAAHRQVAAIPSNGEEGAQLVLRQRLQVT
jgi:hypothetical protein